MVIVLKHVPFEGPGLIAEMLEGRGIPFKAIEVFDEGVPLSAAGFSGIVTMGGPMSVLDGLDAIEREKRLHREASERGIPVLGVCLGAQIIANAFGGRVYRGDRPEIGWGEVELAGEGLSDPLFAGVDNPLSVLHWHGDTFDLPPGAVRLASSDRYENQAFRFGEMIYGFQFHLEMNSDMVREWAEADQASDDGLLNDPGELLEKMKDRLGPVRFSGALVFGRFLDLVAGRRNC
ncbi:MAG: type 1 glutamine amidotransferase [Proteobacteria bacterium]|nr:type 1 glutamine amidotransferase [Pseudomonadota bacterium]